MFIIPIFVGVDMTRSLLLLNMQIWSLGYRSFGYMSILIDFECIYFIMWRFPIYFHAFSHLDVEVVIRYHISIDRFALAT
jgi:hypothetical protein